MQTIPNSTLYLCKNVDLDPSYNYTIDFDNITAQTNYFDSKIASEFEINEGYSYIRDSQTLKVQANIDDLLGINYLFYNNGSKRYYAFITKKEYINPTCTSLTFKLDVLQSFMFNYEIDESFIEREHQDRFNVNGNNLELKYNIETENLDAGTEYDIVSSSKLKDNDNAPAGLVWVEVLASQAIATGNYGNTEPATFKNMCMPLYQNEVRTGLYCYLFPSIIGKNTFTGSRFYTYDGTGAIVSLNDLMSSLASSTAVLAIRVLHYCPIKFNISAYSSGYLVTFPSGYKNSADQNMYDTTAMRVVTANVSNFGGVNFSNYGGYILNLYRIKENINDTLTTRILPRVINKSYVNIENTKDINFEPKLLTYPYQYYQLCDYQSLPLKIKNEYIDVAKNIKYIQSIGIQSKSKLYVENYNNDNGKEYNTINSTISELPLANNAYISYMAQNKATATSGVALNVATGLGTLGLGLATGGIGLIAGVGMAVNSATQIANNLIKMQDLKDTPDSIRQAGNNAEFDLLDNNYQIVLTELRIKSNYREKIFNYFYHYGYKCNDFKKPNTRSRYYFNYIKTIGANIKTNIDADFRAEIENAYNNGLTIWHYRDALTFKGINNYDYENVETNLMED